LWFLAFRQEKKYGTVAGQLRYTPLKGTWKGTPISRQASACSSLWRKTKRALNRDGSRDDGARVQ